MRTAEMFDKPPRAPRRVLMHWDDAGADRGGHFVCRKCGYANWYFDCTETDFHRGIPCPKCNGERSETASSDGAQNEG